MTTKPNILFLMCDQLQAQVLNPDHPCLTPNFDRLAARGLRISRAYTPNAICSPARASLMTGLLPHNHGVLTVTHTVDDDQSCLRTEHPHWAQRLVAADYRTGYFGKWHVERTNHLQDFGWQTNGCIGSPLHAAKIKDVLGDSPPEPEYSLAYYQDQPPGYRSMLLYGVTNIPPTQRGMGLTTSMALDFLDDALEGDDPWCCFASLTEPHDPFVCGEAAYAQYDVDAIELPPNANDDLAGRPAIYRKVARVWQGMSDRQKREAAACYYGSITEIDQQYGRLLTRLEEAGVLDNTIVVLTSDHGELLGAHGLYCKNFSAAEEVYNIPMLIAGPSIAAGAVTEARVGLHDLCPTLLDLTGCEPIDVIDSTSFAQVLADPQAEEATFTRGFAEYHGGRLIITQRVIWDGPWKYVFNGFDFDELYNLDDDPAEMTNLAEDPAYQAQVRSLLAQMWRVIRDTGDHSLYNSDYPILRGAPYGPMLADEA